MTEKQETILRRAKDSDNPFVMIDRNVFEDPTISFKAKGLMGYLLSRPNDWEVRLGDLVKRSTDGASAVQTAIVELEAAGYMTRQRVRGEHGQFFSYVVLVHEVPVPDEDRTTPEKRARPTESPVSGSPQTDNPVVDSPEVENRMLTNSNYTESELTNTPPDEPAVSSRPDFLDLAAKTYAKTKGKGSWTVTEEAGGADPWQDGPLTAFCELVKVEQPPPKLVRGWARAIQAVAEEWGAVPAQAAQAIRLIPDSEHKWHTFSSPHDKGFQSVLGIMIDRVITGGREDTAPTKVELW